MLRKLCYIFRGNNRAVVWLSLKSKQCRARVLYESALQAFLLHCLSCLSVFRKDRWKLTNPSCQKRSWKSWIDWV